MRDNVKHGFSIPQFQLINDWIRTQDQPFTGLPLATHSPDDAATKRVVREGYSGHPSDRYEKRG
jgi:hypothetical protein